MLIRQIYRELVYSTKKVQLHSFICIFQLFRFVFDIHGWHILKNNSISRSTRDCSCSCDNCEGYTGWLTDIPPQSKSRKLYVMSMRNCIVVSSFHSEANWRVITQHMSRHLTTKGRSISRAIRGRSYRYDDFGSFTSWFNDIPPKSESHKMSIVGVNGYLLCCELFCHSIISYNYQNHHIDMINPSLHGKLNGL